MSMTSFDRRHQSFRRRERDQAAVGADAHAPFDISGLGQPLAQGHQPRHRVPSTHVTSAVSTATRVVALDAGLIGRPPTGRLPRDGAADRDGPSRLEHARLRLAYAANPPLADRRRSTPSTCSRTCSISCARYSGFQTRSCVVAARTRPWAMSMRVNAFIFSRSIFGSSSMTIVTTASPSRAHCRRKVGEASHTRRTTGPSSLDTASGDVNPGPAGRQPSAIAGGALTALGLRAPNTRALRPVSPAVARLLTATGRRRPAPGATPPTRLRQATPGKRRIDEPPSVLARNS